MSDHWGFCDEWRGGAFVASFNKKKFEKFLRHLSECDGCARAHKKFSHFMDELGKCADGTCSHGHAGDPPGSYGGSDF